MESPENQSKFVDSEFLTKLERESATLSNINFILNKLNLDGHLNSIKHSLDSIFKGEIRYIAEKLISKRSKKSSGLMKKQIKTNMYIFIKNLKVITNIMGKLISGSNLEGEVFRDGNW